MNKLVPLAIISILMITACMDTATQNRIRPVSGGNFLGKLHLDARIERICVFNTSIAIIFVALIGFALYSKGGDSFLFQVLGTIFLIAAVQLFCQNEVVTFVIIAILVLKPYVFPGN